MRVSTGWSTCCKTEAALTAMGLDLLPYLTTNLMAHRLQIEEWYRRHPEIDDEIIMAPLFGLGLLRAGWSAPSFLLAEVPFARSLRRWEAANPCSPPGTVDGPEPRIAEIEATVELQAVLAPRLASLVSSTATGPEECPDLMALTFRS